MHEMEQLASVQGLPTDRNTLNKLIALHPALNSHISNSPHMVNRGALSGSAQAALALTNYQNLLMRQNSLNSNPSTLQQEGPSSFNSSNQSPSSTFQGPTTLIPGSMQNLPGSGYSSPHLPPQQQQQQQCSLNSPNSMLQQNPGLPSQSSQALQQQMIQQMLQEMSNNCSPGMPQQSLSGQNVNGSMQRSGMGFGNNSAATTVASPNLSGSIGGPTLSKSNSFKGPLNSDSSAGAGGGGGNSNGLNQKAPDMTHTMHMQEDMVQDIAREFTDNTFFNNDLDDNMSSYGWKA